MNIIIKNARLTNCNPQQLSDKDLYQRCKLYGLNARLWLRQFAALLPEVYARRLYKKHKCGSIHEFAYKLGGMNFKTVNKILYLHEKLKDKPALLELFESGSEGWSKLEVVAFVATEKTDKAWAEKVKNLTRPTLAVYVQEFRRSNDQTQLSIENSISQSVESTACGKIQSVELNDFKEGPEQGKSKKNATQFNHEFEYYDQKEEQIGNQSFIVTTGTKDLGGDISKHDIGLYAQVHQNYTFKLSDETMFKLRLIKQKLEKKQKEVLSWNEIFQLWKFEDL